MYPGELADQIVEIDGLLILGVLAALIHDANIDALIDALEGILRLRWRQHTLASPYRHDRLLQASQRLMDIHRQAVAEVRGHRIATTRLMGARKEVPYQLIGRQAGIVVALAAAIGTNSRWRSDQI